MNAIGRINTKWEGDLVYAVKCEAYVKVGKTSVGRLARRVGAMQVGNPFPILLVGTIPCENGEVAERAIHAQLDRLRLRYRGEWFRACAELRNVLDSHGFKCDPAYEPPLREGVTRNGIPLLPVRGGTFDAPEVA